MYIKVKVVASAKKEKIDKNRQDIYMISVKEPAERNLANTRVREIIASVFNVGTKAVRIVSGHQSPSKILSVIVSKNLV